MKSKELKVGVFMAVALVALYFGVDFLKGKDFLASTKKYYAIYENIDELTKSSPVLVNGYAVGRVSNIRIMQERENKVLVEMEIDSDIKLGDSSKAILHSDFLGTKSILLDIGVVTTPRQPKDTIRAEIPASLIDVVTKSAEPLSDNLQGTIRKLNTVLDNLGNNSQALDSIFRQFQTTPSRLNSTLDKTNARFDTLTRALQVTMNNLNGTLSDLKPAVRNLHVFTDSLKRMELNKTVEKTQQAIAKLSAVVDKLGKGDNTASKLLTEDSLYVNLNKVLVSIDSLARHFDNNPKHFLAPLGKSQKKIERARKK